MFPRKKRERVCLLPNVVDRQGLPWCREALLVLVEGTGALRWEDRGSTPQPKAYPYRWSTLTLRGVPLLSLENHGCPTCEDLLATGWGLSQADGPELEEIREVLNGGFASLEEAVPALSPLLGLLKPGLYVLAEGDCFPTDGGGRFFWDVPDDWTAAPATAQIGLTDDDYEYEYPAAAPVFLYPTQRRSRFDPARVDYYQERFRSGGELPHALALHVEEGVSALLDGHHKAAAAALLRRPAPCITIFPLTGYHYYPGADRKMYRKDAAFGPFLLPVRNLPAKWLPEKPWEKAPGPQGDPGPGRLADREWPEEYRTAGAVFPAARESALVAAAETGYPTDGELERWLADPAIYRPQLRAALILLHSQGDPRLLSLALRCAGLQDGWSSLREESFRILAARKGDKTAEEFFIDYFIQLETLPQDRPKGADILTEIAHSFWN